MPQNKRESLIYTVMMCFTMVLWMSFYNAVWHQGYFSMDVLREGWLSVPMTYICAVCVEWFFVSKVAKGFAFRFLIEPESSYRKKVVAISSCMVVLMVTMMSLYGSIIVCIKMNQFGMLPMLWMTNIAHNFIMALPFQLLVAGPLVRFLFRYAFPEGTVLA